MTETQFRARVADLCARVLSGKAGIESKKTVDMAREIRRHLGKGPPLFSCLMDGCDEPGLLLCGEHFDSGMR